MAEHRLRDVGGIPGGLGDFLMGFVMACVGLIALALAPHGSGARE